MYPTAGTLLPALADTSPMNTANVTLRRADEETLGYVKNLLMRNDLPAEDVRENPGAFYVARTGDERVGAGGIEQYGADGLLRSVVVKELHAARAWGPNSVSRSKPRPARAGSSDCSSSPRRPPGSSPVAAILSGTSKPTLDASFGGL